MNKKLSTLVLTLLVVCGCTSTATVPSQNKALGEIRAAINSIAGEPRAISENQREIISQYFGRNPNAEFDAQKSPERLYAKFTILGERRPYDVSVQVFVEQKYQGVFELVGEDEKTADKVAKDLIKRLNQSREDRNIIDDFRPF